MNGNPIVWLLDKLSRRQMTQPRVRRCIAIGVYRVGDVVVVPTSARTEAGFHVEGAPIRTASSSSVQEVAEALLDAARHGNLSIPTPPRDKKPSLEIPQAAGVNTWSALYKRASCWSISLGDSDAVLHQLDRYPRGGFVNGDKAPTTLALSMGLEAVMMAFAEEIVSAES